MSIYLLFFSLVMVYKNWKSIDRKLVLELSVGTTIGVFLGVYILRFGDPLILNKLLGIIILGYIFYHIYSKKKVSWMTRFGWLFGFFGGIFSGLASSGGPFFVSYIYNKINKPAIVRATVIGVLGINNILRFFLLYASGLIQTKLLLLALYVSPFFILSLFVGQMAYGKLNNYIFEILLFVFLGFSAISLLLT